MNNNELFIRKCIKLATLGEGKVSPNPLVGAIVVDIDENVVGEGYHQKYGEAHAEINALNKAGNRAKGGTIYINLEPCSHWGKTPPCADRIIEAGIKKLVIGMIDPNPLVAGEGIRKCQAAGIDVTIGVLNKECEKLNEIFIKNITKNKPFIAIKTASTIDGKIATKEKSSKWITSESARDEVQKLRNRYDAILTGSGTIVADDPSMTCRMLDGRNPVRLIIDSELKTSPISKVYNDDGTRVIIGASELVEAHKTLQYRENVEIVFCPVTSEGKINLDYFIEMLYKKGIYSILVEAGGILNGKIIESKLVDKFYFFIAPKILGDNSGLSLVDGYKITDINQSLKISFDSVKVFEPDILIEAYPGDISI